MTQDALRGHVRRGLVLLQAAVALAFFVVVTYSTGGCSNVVRASLCLLVALALAGFVCWVADGGPQNDKNAPPA